MSISENILRNAEEFEENYGEEVYTLKINRKKNGTYNFHGYSSHFGEDVGFEIGGVDYNTLEECLDISLEQFEYVIREDEVFA